MRLHLNSFLPHTATSSQQHLLFIHCPPSSHERHTPSTPDTQESLQEEAQRWPQAPSLLPPSSLCLPSRAAETLLSLEGRGREKQAAGRASHTGFQTNARMGGATPSHHHLVLHTFSSLPFSLSPAFFYTCTYLCLLSFCLSMCIIPPPIFVSGRKNAPLSLSIFSALLVYTPMSLFLSFRAGS